MSLAAAYEIEHLWRPGGWHSPGFLEVDSQGRVAGAGADRPAASVPVRRIAGFGVPGIANLHSHAFQRALAGRAERTGEDTFWTWRARMYEFVARLDPGHCRAIAAMVYMEMPRARLHRGGRISLPPPRPARPPIRQSGRDVGTVHRRGPRMRASR